ncbi:MAG: DNA repair protein RadA [Myxococcales bacterium]|nr:DNA repair protein RadA [Myxococcales bacterium]
MAKVRTHFVCTACGQTFSKWLGRCTTCDEWGTVEQEVEVPTPPAGAVTLAAPAESRPRRLAEVEGASLARASTGIGELDRVLGGGLVPGALVLVGGDPGIGKSTLLLQASDRIARFSVDVLYVTGEESARQTRLRFDRIGAAAQSLWLVAETSLDRIEAHVAALNPRVLVIDSVQTLHSAEVPGTPGSISQLRAITARLMGLAKGREIVTFLVGHVTKEGALAGPRVLEHMVDTVLYLQGQRGHPFRLLRAVKNRFGSTDEIGAFEMRDTGLIEITNPSALFLAERAAGASGSVVTASFEGTRPLLVEVQALVTPSPYGTPRRTAVGVDQNRVALLLAVLEKKAGLEIGAGDVFVNVAGGLRLDEPAADLAVTAALASSHLDRAIDPHVVLFGEVGLGGEVRGVIGVDARVAEAARLGLHRIVLPATHAETVRAPDGVELVPVATVQAALDALF